MHNFTPLASALGGLLVGLASAALLLGNGRVAGISGIVGGLLRPGRGEVGWRAMFVAGMFASGLVMSFLRPEWFTFGLARSTGAIVVAGLLVGFGTRLANGCTSGHGLCGISRLAPRSIVATVTFMAAGATCVLLINRLFGGRL